LRGTCKVDDLNKAIEKTKPISDQMFFEKGMAKETLKNRAEVSRFVSYNNCLDDLGEAQRNTSTTLWRSAIGAAGAVVTAGGSIAFTGIALTSRISVAAATVGSRIATAKSFIVIGQAMDGVMSVSSVRDAAKKCGDLTNGFSSPAEKYLGPAACGIPTAGQMEFKRQHDGCTLEIVLGAAGAAGFLVGLRSLNSAKQLADSSGKAAAAADKLSTVPNSGKPSTQSVATTQKSAVGAVVAGSNAESSAVKASSQSAATTEKVAESAPLISPPPTENPVLAGIGSDSPLIKLFNEGDYISVTTNGKQEALLILQTEERAGKKMYEVASTTADGKVTKKWIPESELEKGNPKFSQASRTKLSTENMNSDIAEAAIASIRRGASDETVRAIVGKLDDKFDNGAARLEIARAIKGRALNKPGEVDWFKAAHNTASEKTYGDIGADAVRKKLKAGGGRPKDITPEDTRRFMKYGLLGNESVPGALQRAPLPPGSYKIGQRLDLRNNGNTVSVRVKDGVSQDGITWYQLETLDGKVVGRGFTHEQLESLNVAKLDSINPPSQASVVDNIGSTSGRNNKSTQATFKETPVVPSTTPRPNQARLNSASNYIESLNQSEMKTVVRSNKVELTSGRSAPPVTFRRAKYADDVGITDMDRAAAIEYAPVASRADLRSGLQKIFSEKSKESVDLLVKDIRQTMSFNPNNGYVTTLDSANISKFINEVNAKGGVAALEKLPLSSSEREALNAVFKRASSYAVAVDDKVKPMGQLKIKRGPIEATNPNREVVVFDGKGNPIQGKETIRQTGADGQVRSTVQYRKPDGTTGAMTISAKDVMNVGEAQRIQGLNRRITANAEAHEAARIARMESPDFVNRNQIPKSEMATGRDVYVEINTTNGRTKVDAKIVARHDNTREYTVETKRIEGGRTITETHTVDINDIITVKPKVEPVVTVADEVVYRPIDKEIRYPTGQAADPESAAGKMTRRYADQDGAKILTDPGYQLGSDAHIRKLKGTPEYQKDVVVIKKGIAANRDIGRISDGDYPNANQLQNFDPHVFYAKRYERYLQDIEDSKGNVANMNSTQAQLEFKGQSYYDDASNKIVYRNSAKDMTLRAAKEKGMSAEEINALETWIGDLQTAHTRMKEIARVEQASKDYLAIHARVLRAAASEENSTAMAEVTFKELAKSLNDMKLPEEKRKAVEAALRKIRCARAVTEWTSVKPNTYSQFNLDCAH